MKKNILIIIFLILLLIACICYVYGNIKLNTSEKFNFQVIEQTKNYKIIVSKDGEIRKYYYWIFDNENNTIYKNSYI